MSYGQKQDFQLFYGLVVFASVCAILVNALATDSGGTDPEDHAEKIPIGVTQLTKNKYLIDKDAKLSEGEFCRGHGGNTDGETTTTIVSVPNIESTFVQCVADQEWGVKQKGSPNFGRSVVLTLMSPGWYIPTGGLLAIITICLMFTLGKIRRKDRKRVKIDLEQRRREIRTAYAKGEIAQLEFDQAMDRLYAQGVPPAKDD